MRKSKNQLNARNTVYLCETKDVVYSGFVLSD